MNSFTRAAKALAIRVSCAVVLTSVGVALPVVAADKTPSESRSTGAVIDDSAITSKVKASLIADDQVKAFDINVDTYRSAVTLTGAVDNPRQIERASAIAQGVPGVKSVVNRLTVKK